jgi:aspartate racemase
MTTEVEAMAGDDAANGAGEVYVFPASFAQQRLWFLDRLQPGTPAYNVPAVMRLSGPVDARALKRGLDEIVRRHEVLRTTFRSHDGEPVQVVSPEGSVALPLIDLSELAGESGAREVARRFEEEAGRGFDLEAGPLLRASLVRLSADEHALCLMMHHIVSDGWSKGVIENELKALYAAFRAGRPSPLEELPIQYADYAVWQREYLSGETLERELTYWRKQLEGAPPLLALPTDRPRRPALSHAAGVLRLNVEGETYARLQQLCAREGVTLHMLLLAAFMALLARHTGTEDIIVGTPVAGRGRIETEGVVGLFVNTLVMRERVKPSESFLGLLARLRETCLAAYAHQDVPFEKLVEELQPQRSLNHTPLVQAVFNLQSLRRDEGRPQAGAGVAAEQDAYRPVVAKFDLTLSCLETGSALIGGVEYSADLFERQTVAWMAEHYSRLLDAVAEDPSRPVSELRMAGEDEERLALCEWGGAGRGVPPRECIHEHFRAQALSEPGKTALRFGEGRLSYAELDARAGALARRLRARGVGPEVLVGLLTERSSEMVVALLAILKAGGAYLPLDPQYPRERLRFMLEDACAPLVLAQAELAGRLPESSAEVVLLEEILREPDDAPGEELEAGAVPDNLAYVMYTSGSTGRPKGVRVTHGGVVRLVKETDYAEFGGTFLLLAPISFDASTFEVWGPLLNGGELVVMPPGAPGLGEIAEAVERNGVTTLWLTAALFEQMVDFNLGSLRGVRQLLAGGDALSVAHVRRVIQSLGENRLVNGYGPTENTTFSCCRVMTSASDVGASVPIGRPIANTHAYVLDGRMNPCPLGVPGELYVGGAGLARDYLRRPSLTAERFVPDALSSEPGARLYRTGDLVRWLPSGELEFLGRIDQQVKVRGFRIELGEIEAALLAQPGVRQAAVVAREAGGEKQLVGYVVREEGSAGDVRAGLRGLLPEYMVPQWVVELEALPLTPNGKLDRDALPAPEASLQRDYAPPRDVVEFKVAKVWEEVLAVRPVGIRDNFFDLGGHSLAAVRLMAHLRGTFGRELPLAALFQNGTVEELSRLLREGGDASDSSPLVGINTSGTRPPFFCVHPAGGNVLCYAPLARHLGEDQPFYGLQSVGGGEPDAAAALEQTAARYAEAMRAVQPAGPYHLGGWSLGGPLAFEIARQLRTAGERVALLALFDSWAPLSENKPWGLPGDESKLLAQVARSHRVSLPKNGAAPRGEGEELERAFEAAKAAGLLPPGVGVAWLRRLVVQHGRAVSAVLDYEPAVYDGQVTLFRAREGAARGDWGWGRLTSLPVNVREVAGDHHTMLSEPHVGELAADLDACLRAASAG